MGDIIVKETNLTVNPEPLIIRIRENPVTVKVEEDVIIKTATSVVNITVSEAAAINITEEPVIIRIREGGGGETGGGGAWGEITGNIANQTDLSNILAPLSAHLGNYGNPHGVTKSQVGLGNVDNTEDMQKPVSTATLIALGAKADIGHSHTEADITDLDKYTQAEVGALLSGKSDIGHDHDDRYYTVTEIDNANFLNEEGANEFYLRKDQNLADLPDWSIALESLRLTSENENEGASKVYIHDADGRYDSRDVERAFREVMVRAANLSDLIDIEEARANLEVYSDAEIDTMLEGYLASENNLSDIGNAATARGNLDVQSTSESDARYIRRANNSTKDQGYEQNSSVDGITADYISDKTYHNVRILGHPAPKRTGSFWLDTTVTPNVFHIYHDGAIKNIMTDLTMANGRLQHHPLGFDIDIMSGNSDQRGCNGLPLVQEYGASQGAYPVPILIDGGSF